MMLIMMPVILDTQQPMFIIGTQSMYPLLPASTGSSILFHTVSMNYGLARCCELIRHVCNGILPVVVNLTPGQWFVEHCFLQLAWIKLDIFKYLWQCTIVVEAVELNGLARNEFAQAVLTEAHRRRRAAS